MKTLTSAGRQLAIALLLPVVLLAAWWALTANTTSFYFPPLQEILELFAPTWLHERLLSDIVPSLTRLAVGYLSAIVLGIGIGVVVGLLPAVRRVLEPMFEFLRAIPPPVLVPILILFAGIGDTMKVVVIVVGCVWPVLLNTEQGVRALDPTLQDTGRIYRMRPASRLFRMVLPNAAPQIATGARQALSIGIILMVISEMFAAQDGIGYTVTKFQHNFEIPEMWTGIILLGLIGFILSVLFRFTERRILRWYHGARRAERS